MASCIVVPLQQCALHQSHATATAACCYFRIDARCCAGTACVRGTMGCYSTIYNASHHVSSSASTEQHHGPAASGLIRQHTKVAP